MTYKDYEIGAEVITERAEYTLDDEGNLKDYVQYIDSEPEISCYSISKDDEIIDWVDSLKEAKRYIEDLILAGVK